MTHEARSLHVALFFSHGVSLAEWKRRGLFDREVGHYRALAARLGRVTCVTYDIVEPDGAVLAAAAPLAFLWNRWRLPYPVFGILAPWLHRRALATCDVLRTNQLSGAWTAVLAKRILHKPLVVRCGFVGSQFYRLAGLRRWRISLREALERKALEAADLVFVASEADAEYLRELCRGRTAPIVVLPNAVDIDRFAPKGTETVRGRVVFIGRLTAQKNLPMLFEAVRQLDGVSVQIAGTGELDAELRSLAAGLPVEFLGSLPNRDLPALLASAEVFVLPSHYEGTPKALLEAMAAGCAVVGTDAPGTREVIRDGVTGLLCACEPSALADGIRRLLADGDLRRRLGSNARQAMVAGFSRESIIAQEEAAVRSLLARSEH